MLELKTQAELDKLKKDELVALVLQIQEEYKKKLEATGSAEVVELQKKLNASEAANKELTEDLVRVNALLAKSEKNSKAEADVITVGETSIRLLSRRFKYQGRVITPEVLKADETLVAALIEDQCSLIEVVK